MALVYLLITGILGVLFLLFPGLVPYFRVTHVHVGVVGFFLSVVMGVAFWMMPRPGGLRQEGLEAWTFYLLNSSLLLRLVFEPYWHYSASPLAYVLTVGSGLLTLSAMGVFAWAMQARIKTKEEILALRLAREAKAKP